MKHFGSSSSATISALGGNANQFSLKWENIPINNPMLGLSDLSIITPNLFDTYEINVGGSMSENGPGGVTGSLNLYSEQVDNVNSILLNYGSFGNRSVSARLNKTFNKLSVAIKAHHQSAQNNFVYDLSPQLQRRNENAQIRNNAINANLNYAFSDHLTLKYHLWLQDFNRAIPPTTVQNRSEAFQEDKLNRNLVDLTYKKNQIKSRISFAYFDEINAFQDSLTRIFSDNEFTKWHYQLENTYYTSSGKLSSLIFYNKTEAKSQFYENDKVINQSFASINYQFNIKKIKLDLGLATEFQNSNHLGITPSVSSEYTFRKYKTSAKLARLVRAPTINELYWRPGGNSSLLPESGWSSEISQSIEFNDTQGLRLTGFFRSISNWLLWAQDEGSLFFEVSNIAKVHSYGLNLVYDFTIKSDHLTHHFLGQYNWTNSKNQVAIANPRIDKGSQLFYTPLHQINLKYKLVYKNLKLSPQLHYNSSSIGTLEKIDGYYLVDLHLAFKAKYKNLDSFIFININNLTNSKYQILERRPMPGRNFNLGVSFKI